MAYRKVTEFKTPEEFAQYVKSENFHIGIAPEVKADGSAALAQPIRYKGRTIGNRWAVLPMEGWDCMVNSLGAGQNSFTGPKPEPSCTPAGATRSSC